MLRVRNALIALAIMVPLIGVTGVDARVKTSPPADMWELCWTTAQGACKYKCSAGNPGECPCAVPGSCGGGSEIE